MEFWDAISEIELMAFNFVSLSREDAPIW
jgi:hypothetical protein